MIIDIRIFNRSTLENFLNKEVELPFENVNWNLISIHGNSGKFLNDQNTEVLKQKGLVKYLTLEFWDIANEPDLICLFRQDKLACVLFNEDHAKKIMEFLNEIKESNENEILVCQCDAGISRSGAVGEFACEFLGLDYFDFISKNKQIDPNPMIRRILRKVSGLGGQSSFLTAKEIEERKMV